MTDVFFAIGDETRRGLLDRLRLGGSLSITELAVGLPMTRQAVTKHLDVLESAGLVRQSTRGRERLHELVDAPLRDVDDWLAPYEAAWDRRLERLRSHIEQEGEPDG